LLLGPKPSGSYTQYTSWTGIVYSESWMFGPNIDKIRDFWSNYFWLKNENKFLDAHSDRIFFSHTSVQLQVQLKFNWKHKKNREVLCRKFTDLSFIGTCDGARSQVRCNWYSSYSYL